MSAPVPPAGAALLEVALAAAGRGWHVFPLRPDAKRPAVRRWESRATRDRKRIERCWAAGPYGVGVACGPSGLVVLDLDLPKDAAAPPPAWDLPGVATGADVLTVLAKRAGQPSPTGTYTVHTATGGLHLYYEAPADGPPLRNTAGRLGWLIDTRAAGGYVIAAGCSVAGHPYTADDPTRPVAALPGWIARRLTGPPPPLAGELAGRVAAPDSYAAAALHDEITQILRAGVGTRNDTLNRAAYALGQLVAAGLLPEAATAEVLATAGMAAGLTPEECAATVHSGMSAGTRHPRPALAGNSTRPGHPAAVTVDADSDAGADPGEVDR
jgi:Bifunctional DNA primase/polymerase, N-terminal